MYNITWQPLPREKRNGEITVYEVKTSAFPKQCTRGAISNLLDNYVNVTRKKYDLVLSDLRPCTDYEVQVRAYTTAGPSEFGIVSIPIDTSGENCNLWFMVIFTRALTISKLFRVICSSFLCVSIIPKHLFSCYASAMLPSRFELPTV